MLELLAAASLYQFNFHFENDFVFQTDKYYTHSSKLEFIFQIPSRRFLIFDVKQSMYTPKDHKQGYLDDTDMPYTGYMRVSGGIYTQTDYALWGMMLFSGWSGAYSFAEETMELIHNIIPTQPVYYGWETQEEQTYAGISGSYQRRIALADSLELIGATGAKLSNFKTNVYADFQLRFGGRSNDFATLAQQRDYPGIINVKEPIWQVYVGASTEYVAKDASLRGLSIEPFVYATTAGVAYKRPRWNFTFCATLESRRFTTQKGSSFGYGNFVIGYLF